MNIEKKDYEYIVKIYETLGMQIKDKPDFEQLYNKCMQLKSERDKYYMAMDNCVDSFHIADSQGTTIFVNKAFENRSKISRKNVIGANATEMERLGIYRPSAVRIALQENRRITLIQGGPGGDALVTATPVYDEEGKTLICVSNARWVDELELLDNYYQSKDIKETRESKKKKYIFKDEKMIELYEYIQQIAKADSSILISGETGTGKSMIARYIHENSNRRKGKFIELNCAAIPENLIESEIFGYESGAFTGAKKGGKPGMFELADGGTLFLDEIGDMPLMLQSKLLSTIQNKKITRIGGTEEKQVDVRIITATNKDIESLVDQKLFRRDLYYRINVVPIYMPALRERKKDIEELVYTFLETFNDRYGRQVKMLESAANILKQYKWPGNIRELENLMERLVVTNKTGVISAQDIPNGIKIMTDDNAEEIQINKIMPLKKALEETERKLVQMVFEEADSTYKAAELLDISQSGASRKFLKYVKKTDPEVN